MAGRALAIARGEDGYGETAKSLLARLERRQILFPIPGLNRRLQLGSVLVVDGISGSGKTALATEIARLWADQSLHPPSSALILDAEGKVLPRRLHRCLDGCARVVRCWESVKKVRKALESGQSLLRRLESETGLPPRLLLVDGMPRDGAAYTAMKRVCSEHQGILGVATCLDSGDKAASTMRAHRLRMSPGERADKFHAAWEGDSEARSFRFAEGPEPTLHLEYLP